MTLNGVMAVTLRCITEFGKPAFQYITTSARKKESSRSLSHLLMSFLLFAVSSCLVRYPRLVKKICATVVRSIACYFDWPLSWDYFCFSYV